MSSSMASSRLLRRDLLTAKAGTEETLVPASREPGDYQFFVSFPSSLRLQKVEVVRVEVAPLQPGSGNPANRRKAEIIPLRLHIPGALVAPAEQGIEVTLLGPTQAVFYVTPLAEGSLPAAHLEVLHPGRTEGIALPLKVRPRRGSRWLVLALVPLLLGLPALWPELAGGELERRLLHWLPGKFGQPLAHLAQNTYSFLAHQGAQYSLSFWSLVLLAAAWCIWRFGHRAGSVVVRGMPFRLPPATAAKTPTPPPFLTPLTEHEMAEIQKRK
ncbi:MAG TPA: hypothetical protein VGZ47_07655 [Gemmataceae bacterium]|jgi:hypothetical protein|nr:hypothetical protein [Gemmataceae bacterium]